MNILRIVYDWPPPWDGLAPHPYEVTLSQIKKGHDITVFAGSWPGSGKPEEPQGIKVVPFYREPLQGTMILTTALLMFSYYLSWRKVNTPDILHIHGHFGFWIYLYRLYLQRFKKDHPELKVPIVAHFHNTVEGRKQKMLSDGKYIKPISKYLAWPLAKLSDQWAIKFASAYIFVSQDTLEEAVKFYGADRNNCYLVETGVNTSLFVPIGGEEKEKSRRDLGIDPTDKVILNHGKMVERKNIHLLVSAMKYLPEYYKLVLMGSGDPDYIYKLKELIEDSKLHNRVIMIGYTPYPQVPIAFQVADLFVLPSSWEGLPKVLMQSLSCGVKALVSGFRVSNDISGLFYLDNLEPEYIAQKIQECVNSTVEVDRNKVINNYSWDGRVEIIERVYEKVLQNKSTSNFS